MMCLMSASVQGANGIVSFKSTTDRTLPTSSGPNFRVKLEVNPVTIISSEYVIKLNSEHSLIFVCGNGVVLITG